MKKLSMLIVDDEIEIAMYIRDIVMRKYNDDIKIYTCYSGTKALEILQTKEIDVLVSDIVMPVVNGFKLLEYVACERPQTEIILLTAFRDFDYIYRANKIKTIDYIVKSEPDNVILRHIHTAMHKCKAYSEVPSINDESNNEVSTSKALMDNSDVITSELLTEKSELIRLVLDYIKTSKLSELNVNHIAEVFHYTPIYISKLFAAEMNIKLSEYLQDRKLILAKQMLSDTFQGIGDIAQKIGYQSSQSFSRAFKKEFNISPQEYRHLHGSGK